MEETTPAPLSPEAAMDPALPLVAQAEGAPPDAAPPDTPPTDASPTDASPTEARPLPERDPPPPRPLLNAHTLPLALSYTWCPTTAEFLEQQAPPGSPLEQRLREVRLTPEAQRVLVESAETLHLLALVPEGLPDSVGVVPLWIRLAEGCPRAELRFAGEAEFAYAERLLAHDPVLHVDALELPHLLFFDEEWHPVAHWGPRPHAADPLLDEWLAQHPDYELLSDGVAAELHGDPVDPAALRAAAGQPLAQAFATLNQQLMLQMRIWYNSGLDAEACNELQALLAGLHDETDGAEGGI